ncbi:hypothetical protein GCT13_24645 [Paraburkholderia sp. CNPSo 3157]|uniref:Alpha/beta hydrolase n=1 Tax=Paraburkholderia franconis TaxID=2654983 RepID=A0A7X1NDK3_9BURK|nr:hypothetical protein [Paraburkholderia franconis]MPW19997.1 hypothetical protein [Paraburkholderia franconis]
MDYAERQREVFPSAEVLILRESGHWPFIDDPDAVALTIVPFLRMAVSCGLKTVSAEPASHRTLAKVTSTVAAIYQTSAVGYEALIVAS